MVPPALPAELPEDRACRRWLGLAVSSLVLAGLLSLTLVVARAPGIAPHIDDPGFFRRCLVVHVDLSLLVWLFAFVAALAWRLPGPDRSGLPSRAGVVVAGLGVVFMLAATTVRGAVPVLANYVPMIDHWSFGVGLTTFAVGVLLGSVDGRLLSSEAPVSPLLARTPAAVPALRATILLLCVAGLTFLAAWIHRPAGLSPEALYELTAWGGGHVLMAAASVAMVGAWLLLLTPALGRAPVSRRWSAALCGALVLLWAGAPVLPRFGIDTHLVRTTYTRAMQWGVFPLVLPFLIACWVAVARAARSQGAALWLDGRVLAFMASTGLTVLGWVLGALIRGSTTLVPGHYHAAIGGVTAAFMGLTFPLLADLGISLGTRRLGSLLARWQPAIFGVGQAAFALGFAIAGTYGMGRKLYGAEQHARTLGEVVGLAVMGLGGLVAVAGGLIFLSIAGSALLRHRPVPASAGLAPIWRHS